MRITTNAQYRETGAAISQAAERLALFQRQVASGKRVERPSDDPFAAAAVTVEHGRQATIDRYVSAADSANSRLTVADSALTNLIDQLGAARVTVLGARGTTQTPVQREAKALDLEGLRDGIQRDVNTQFRGAYIFGGAAGTTKPYQSNSGGVISSYQGSTNEVFVDVDTEHEVNIAFNGEALAKGAEPDDIFVALNDAIAAVRSGNESGLGAALEAIEKAQSRAAAMQSRVGASLRTVEADKISLAAAARSSAARVSALEDANLAAAISSMTQAETIYRAALGAAAQVNRVSLMDYLQ